MGKGRSCGNRNTQWRVGGGPEEWWEGLVSTQEEGYGTHICHNTLSVCMDKGANVNAVRASSRTSTGTVNPKGFLLVEGHEGV